MKHRTTKEHYEKYRDMATAAGVSLDTDGFMGFRHEPCESERCGECWMCMYMINKHLNFVPLKEWDAIVRSYWACQGRGIIGSLGDGVCVYKHLVLYQILELEPEFAE